MWILSDRAFSPKYKLLFSSSDSMCRCKLVLMGRTFQYETYTPPPPPSASLYLHLFTYQMSGNCSINTQTCWDHLWTLEKLCEHSYKTAQLCWTGGKLSHYLTALSVCLPHDPDLSVSVWRADRRTRRRHTCLILSHFKWTDSAFSSSPITHLVTLSVFDLASSNRGVWIDTPSFLSPFSPSLTTFSSSSPSHYPSLTFVNHTMRSCLVLLKCCHFFALILVPPVLFKPTTPFCCQGRSWSFSPLYSVAIIPSWKWCSSNENS